MAEVVNIKQHEAERAVHALHAVGFAKQDGEQGLAVVDAGEPVQLRIGGGGVAQAVELKHCVTNAEYLIDSELPVGWSAGAKDEIVDDSF